MFASNGSPRTGDPTKNIPSIAITAENYNRIARLLEHEVPVKLAFDIKTKFDTSNTDSFNVIAEIPGTTKPNEVVMVGGHFDSWHMGTGATDNGAGSAVAMEVMRILKSLNLKMDRTVRMALWGGEEEGLLGSQAYVKEHFADPRHHEAHRRARRLRRLLQHRQRHRQDSRHLSAGQRNAAARSSSSGSPRIKDVTARRRSPSAIPAARIISPSMRVGLPGFQFIQDPLDYDSRTHHSNMDVYDRVQQADLEQMAVVEAFFVYQAATRPEKLPRKDLPPPTPPAGRGGRGRGAAANR